MKEKERKIKGRINVPILIFQEKENDRSITFQIEIDTFKLCFYSFPEKIHFYV